MIPEDVPVVFGAGMLPLWRHPRPERPTDEPGLFEPTGPPREDSANRKPSGGLWTSPMVTYQGREMTAYEAWATGEERTAALYHLPARQVTALPHAVVAVVDAPEHWKALYAAFPLRHEPWATPAWHIGRYPFGSQEEDLDWAALAAHADALALTGAALSWSNTSLTSLAGWDMPTVYWLRPRFTVQ
jgi:hypothetical protein